MTEKQRWLLKDLELWQRQELERIGRYAPKKTVKEPTAVRAARRQAAQASKVLRAWEAAKAAPWQRAKQALEVRYQGVRRIILFEKTEVALKAIKELR